MSDYTSSNMAKRFKLPDIYWDISKSPQENVLIRDQIAYSPTEEQWEKIVLPKNKFEIEYPFARYNETNLVITYETEGDPITLLDLLTIIHEFYQEEISVEELTFLQGHDRDEIYGDVVKRIDAMNVLVDFSGLEQISDHCYKLVLGV